MVSKKLIFKFILISLLFWLAVNYFVPLLITVDVIENKFVYFAIKNFAYAFLVSLLAVTYLEQMQVRKVAAWLFLPIVIFPILFAAITFYVFIGVGAKTILELVVGSFTESCIYWIVAFGIFSLIQRWRKIKLNDTSIK